MIHHNGRPDLFKPYTQKYSLEDFNKVLNDDSKPVFVITDVDHNETLGYSFCQIIHKEKNAITDGRKYLYIDDYCVDERSRGLGIGAIFLEYIRNYAKDQNCYSIELNVWNFNQGAIAFYERSGFSTQRRQMEMILND